MCGVVDWNTLIYDLTNKNKFEKISFDEQPNIEEKNVKKNNKMST